MSDDDVKSDKIENTNKKEVPTTTDNDNVKSETPFSDTIGKLLTKTNAIYAISFLGIYIVMYFVIGKFVNTSAVPLIGTRIFSLSIDVIIFVIFAISGFTFYNEYLKHDDDILETIKTNTMGIMNNPNSIVSVGLFIICLYLIIYMFRIPNESSTKPMLISLIENVAWFAFIIIGIWNFFKYAFIYVR